MVSSGREDLRSIIEAIKTIRCLEFEDAWNQSPWIFDIVITNSRDSSVHLHQVYYGSYISVSGQYLV
jgi:hypothetical protein